MPSKKLKTKRVPIKKDRAAETETIVPAGTSSKQRAAARIQRKLNLNRSNN